MAKQTIRQALTRPAIVRALNGLVGCPAGGWGDTDQAVRRLADEIPIRELRAYTASQLIDAALELDHADRFRWRAGAVASANA